MDDDDLFKEITGYDIVMGTDTVDCPHCGAEVQCSNIMDGDEITCPDCGTIFKKE